MVTTERSYSDVEKQADKVMIGLLTRLAAMQYKDSDFGKELFKIMRMLAIEDPVEKAAYEKRIDHYAECWQQGSGA